MNIETKFRGLSLYDNEFRYGQFVKLEGETDIRTFFDTSDKRDHKFSKINLDYHFIVNQILPDEIGWNHKDCFQFTKVIPESVGQFTGLKDKNGIEIYKGDILKITEIDEESASGDEFNYNGVVIYGNDGEIVGKNFVTSYPCSFTIYCKDWHHEEGLLGNYRHQYEVIGNIHQKQK